MKTLLWASAGIGTAGILIVVFTSFGFIGIALIGIALAGIGSWLATVQDSKA